MGINNPIFIVASGRSGTTILYKLLSIHPDLCWFSKLSNKFPYFPQISFLHRILDFPIIGRLAKNNIISATNTFPKCPLMPVEGGTIYHKYIGLKPTGKSKKEDYDKEKENEFKQLIKNHLKMTRRDRFLSKQTSNTQRLEILNKMFPNAFIIHILRDGRAVSNSLLNVNWWQNTDIWWWKGTPQDWAQEGKPPIRLCALHWKHNVTEILKNKKLFEPNYLSIKYESLVENPPKILKKVINFCELSQSKEYLSIIPKKLPNMNFKWKKMLTDKQKSILMKTIGDELEKLGYI